MAEIPAGCSELLIWPPNLLQTPSIIRVFVLRLSPLPLTDATLHIPKSRSVGGINNWLLPRRGIIADLANLDASATDWQHPITFQLAHSTSLARPRRERPQVRFGA